MKTFSEGVRNISNKLSISEVELASPNLIEEATKLGLYKPEDGWFDFAKVFSKDWEDPARVESAARRFKCGGELLKSHSTDGNFFSFFSEIWKYLIL